MVGIEAFSVQCLELRGFRYQGLTTLFHTFAKALTAVGADGLRQLAALRFFFFFFFFLKGSGLEFKC